MTIVPWVGGLALLSLFAVGMVGGGVGANNGHPSLVDRVREANGRFNDVSVAVAEGYAPVACASGGATGIHYVNPNYLRDPIVDIRRPQAVVYEATPGGRRKLVAVEYIAFKGPAALEGHPFTFNGTALDPSYELHVWAWKENPLGPFADANPNVACVETPEE